MRPRAILAIAIPVIPARCARRFAPRGLGAIPLHGNAGEFGGMLAAETERWRKVVELPGIRKE